VLLVVDGQYCLWERQQVMGRAGGKGWLAVAPGPTCIAAPGPLTSRIEALRPASCAVCSAFFMSDGNLREMATRARGWRLA
jgi:hypothetical protein